RLRRRANLRYSFPGDSFGVPVIRPERPNQVALAGVPCLYWWEGDFPTAIGSLQRCAQLLHNLKASRPRSPARAALAARPVHRVVRLALLLPGDDVRFRRADDIKQLLLLSRRDLEFVQGLLELLGHHAPLFLADVQMNVGFLHRLSGVLAWPTGHSTDHLRHLELKVRRRRSLPAGVNGGILVQFLIRHE